jgi:PAS domain S-box-containing protein
MENKTNKWMMQIFKMANRKEAILYVLMSVTGILLLSFIFTKIIMVEYLVAMLLALLLVISLLFEYKKTKSIRKELLKQAHANKIILNHFSEGLITTNQKGEIQFMNLAAEKLTGWKKQEATNQLLHQVFKVEHENTGEGFENVITRVLKNGRAIINENHSILKTSDFKKINIINSGLPMLNGEGKITGAVLLFKPVAGEKESGLKEKEEIYKTIIEQASDAIFINDTKGNLLEVNNSACSLLGYTKEQFAKMNITDLHTKEALLLKPIMYDKLLSGERTIAERSLQHSNGSTVPVEITAKMLSDGRIMAIVRDIKERKKAEKKSGITALHLMSLLLLMCQTATE